jgi:hypothetical protein
MWAGTSSVQCDWKTMNDSNNHELRAFAPLGLSHFGSPFFATTKVPLIKHSDSSSCPTPSRWRARVSSICRIRPALTQRLNRLKQVQPEGNRSGRSAQRPGMPYPQNPVQDSPVAMDFGSATSIRAPSRWWNQGWQYRPLFIGRFFYSRHDKSPSCRKNSLTPYL